MLEDAGCGLKSIKNKTEFGRGYDDAWKRECDRSSLNATDIMKAHYMQGWLAGEADYTAWEHGYDAALDGSQSVCPYMGSHDRIISSWIDGWQCGAEAALLTVGEC